LTVEYVPGTQAEQAPLPPPENVPAAQLLQTVAPASENVAEGHSLKQHLDWLLLAPKKPAGIDLTADNPTTGTYVPAGATAHLDRPLVAP
jgi:hypothetical protein